jgi:serine/threonine-protein kinase
MDAAGSATPGAFGPFRVLHQIGAGALGPVFRAYEPDRDRLVAVKVFRLGLPPERVQQLVAELEQLIAAGLTHPGIAAPVAAGVDGGAAYLAHDYVAADSFDIVVRDDGPARPADALRFGAQLAGSLDFATAVDINHGALHPRDVLVSQEEVRITGLGVTRALERVGVAAPVRRPYTAPERVAGAAWDRRADIFSLAALMHEMLWGRRISGTGAQAAGTLTDLAGGDLAALRRVFARALADDPGERFERALAFAEALHEAFPGMGTAAPPPASRRSMVGSLASFEEPRLPLDDAVEVSSSNHEPDRPATRAADGSTRYLDIEEPPTAIERPPGGLMEPCQPEPVSALEQSRSTVWPLALALIVGLGLGFGGGYAVGIRDRSAPAVAALSTPAAAPQSAVIQPGREWTEGAVNEPARSPEPARSGEPVRSTRSSSVRLQPDLTPGGAEVRPTPATATDGAAADRPNRGVRPEADARALGRLLIRSRPAGARVFVDGRDRGQTPATVPGLGRGTHRIRLVRDGYSTEDRRVVITSHSAPSMTIALMRAPQPSIPKSAPAASATTGQFVGALTIDSRPQGAAVFIDGKLAGATPLNVPAVPAGEHAVRLEREGYRRWTSSVRVVASGQNRVTASLEK